MNNDFLMDQQSIDQLKEALSFSPNNIPLRLHLAEVLFKLNRLDEAEQEFQQVLNFQSNNEKAKLGLAEVYFKKGNFSVCNVVLEELIQTGTENPDVHLLHIKALIEEKMFSQAVSTYQELQRNFPGLVDLEIEDKLKLHSGSNEEDDLDISELMGFMSKPDINFSHVGGMDAVKKEIEMKIIFPLKHPEMYKAYGKKTGGGILLYGPPGCGKTFIAKATAGEVNAQFISVGLNDILDMWIGNSEKNLHEVFERARAYAPCVLFFDEIDALGASRSDMRQSSGRHLINQFLQELDGVESNNDGVLILGATNSPWHLDPAFRRPGRFDRIIFVPPPDEEARESIFKLKLENKPLEKIDYSKIIKLTKEYSGADIEAIIDISIESKLHESMKTGVPLPIQTKDILKAIEKHFASTREWFTQARNFALYANESGLYDDILKYLNIKK
jgi:ATP-dependent 26S proteasome regulatory subunit